MKSVGEAMAIGRTFKEALQKALRRLEIKRFGLFGDGAGRAVDPETLRPRLSVPNAERIFFSPRQSKMACESTKFSS